MTQVHDCDSTLCILGDRAFIDFVARYYARTRAVVSRARHAKRAGLEFECAHLAACVSDMRATIRTLRIVRHRTIYGQMPEMAVTIGDETE